MTARINSSGSQNFSLIFFKSSSGKSHHSLANNSLEIESLKRFLINLAGTPPHISYGGISFVTIAPAAMIAPVPICLTDGSIITFCPIQASESIEIREYYLISLFVHLYIGLKKHGWVDAALIGWLTLSLATLGAILT